MPDFVVPLGFFLLVLALILYKKKRKKKGGTSSGGPRNQQMLKVSNNWGSLTSFLKGEDLGFLSRTPDGVMLSTADRDGQSGKTHFYKFNGPIQNKNVTEIWSKPGKQTGGGAGYIVPLSDRGSLSLGMVNVKLYDVRKKSSISPYLHTLPNLSGCTQFFCTEAAGHYIVGGIRWTDDGHDKMKQNKGLPKFADANGPIKWAHVPVGKVSLKAAWEGAGETAASKLGGPRRNMRMYIDLQRHAGMKNFSACISEWVNKKRIIKVSRNVDAENINSVMAVLKGSWSTAGGVWGSDQERSHCNGPKGKSRDGLGYNDREAADFGIFTESHVKDASGAWWAASSGWSNKPKTFDRIFLRRLNVVTK